MENLLSYVVIIALATSFTIISLAKVKVLEWFQINGSDFEAKLANCTFCLSFWISLIFSIGIAILLKDLKFIAIPIFATPISRYLV